MKRDKFIKKALKHIENTVCVNTAQVDVMLTIFEDLGMLPPDTVPNSCSLTTKDWKIKRDKYIFTRFSWEEEDEA